jgi:hypothetical protein
MQFFRVSSNLLLLLLLVLSFPLAAQDAEPWQQPYTGDDAEGKHVLGFWRFDSEEESVTDSSGRGHNGRLKGAVFHEDGRFGGGLQCFPGWPVSDACHGAVIPNHPDLSPGGAFTVEAWVCPDAYPEEYGDNFILDKKYASYDDYQWILSSPDSSGLQRMRVILGFGENADTWWSSETTFTPGVWSHLAFTYDGAGEVRFFKDGHALGTSSKAGRGSIHGGAHDLVLGDRVGSYHHGFTGRIDEVRLTAGVREFQPCRVTLLHDRTVYERFEETPQLRFEITNIRNRPLEKLRLQAGLRDSEALVTKEVTLGAGESQVLEFPFDTSLRPDDYIVAVNFHFNEDGLEHSDQVTFPVTLVSRKLPARMPVVMWGVGGVKEVEKALPTLKDIGFTHCLGLRCDFDTIWEAEGPVQSVKPQEYADSCAMLDLALANDLGVVIGLSPGHWMSAREDEERLDREGNPYDRRNVCCNFSSAPAFAQRVGASVAQTFGAFPAFTAAMINTEVRDGTQLCFHDHDRALYRAATGLEIPEEAVSKNGVSYGKLTDFPADRVVEENHPLLQFYRWFWKEGDGWNGFHSALCDGLKEMKRSDFWTYFDPAVRVPPLWGSGGSVDFLSHWTYSYPDPLRLGLAADELFAMAEGGPDGQQVMKMTQIIWYRSQTAPMREGGPRGPRSAWEDYDPDADYITIAPTHLREAFWHKISRPVKGIMYHGWQSLVETEGKSVYRYTHPETRQALKDLVETVVTPLGPTLAQLPAAKTDVAFLESFTSTIFASRGSYGWGASRASDVYHMLLYAQLRPKVVYEETLLREGLKDYKILVLADCDVLTRPVVALIKDFQQGGGIVVGDDRLCPAIQADITVNALTRAGKADEDKAAILAEAAALATQLAPHYKGDVFSSDAEVLPYKRSFASTDYIFAINDKREFGTYVGQHGLVMENGLPASATFTLDRGRGFVYDLVNHRQVPAEVTEEGLQFPMVLEPGGGRFYMVTHEAIDKVTVSGDDHVSAGARLPLSLSVVDDRGEAVDALVPVEVRIRDADGRVAEASGYYGAPAGKLTLTLDIASNDTPGMWTVEVRELASNRSGFHFFRVQN